MADNFLDDLLIDPVTGEKLIFDIASNCWTTADKATRYPVVDSIPQILTGIQDSSVAEIHREHNSVFNYVDHYQKDAILDDYSESRLPGVTKNELHRLRESILREITGDDQAIILDAGCGKGWVSKKLIPKGKRVISMDVSSTNPLKAVNALPHKNHAGLVADGYYIPIRENSIDFIVASEILEHVPDPGRLIRNLIKLLKINGKLIITTPYNEKIEYFLCVHCNKQTPKSAHLHSFNENNIGQMIPPAGVKWSYKKLTNRNLSKIRSYILLKFLPFSLWTLIDDLFNSIFGNPTRLKLVIEKII